jgi:hypothetical protein
MFILTGGPGTGKSMIMAWLAGRGPMPVEAEARQQLEQLGTWVKAVHFCVAASGSTDPKELARQMAGQLTRKVPGFGLALAATLGDQVKIATEQHVGRVEKGGSFTGVYIANLNLSGLSEELSFNRILRDPLKRLYEDGYEEPMLLLVDALDEALTYSGGTNVVHLLAKLTDLPTKVRILATTRPDPRVLKCFREVKPFDLIVDAPSDADDIRLYVDERLALSTPAIDYEKRDLLAKRISEAAKGIFLYAYMVLGDLIQRLPNVPDLENYPLSDGLSGLYHDFLNRELGREENRWYVTFRPLLGLIAVAQGEGFTKTQLQQITSKELEQALRVCKQYLIGDLPEGPFRPFHRSFVDFLLEDKENIDYHIDATSVHRQIVEYYRANAESWATVDWSVAPRYALRHLVAHLYQLRQVNGYRNWLHALLETRSFIDQHLASLHKPYLLLDNFRLALNLALEHNDLAQAWCHIREYRRVVSDQIDFERLLTAVEKGNKTGDYGHVTERTTLYGYMPNSQALARLLIAWNAAASGHNTAAESIVKGALERLPPRGTAQIASRQAGSSATQAVEDAIGETLQRLLIRIAQAAKNTIVPQGDWLRHTMSPWPTLTVDATVGRLSESLTSWGEIFDAGQTNDTMESLFQELQERGGRLVGDPNPSLDRDTIYFFQRRLAAGLFNSRQDPSWMAHVKRCVALIALDDYPSYREMALAWVAAAALAQEDLSLAQQALAAVLQGMFRPAPGFWGDTVAAAMDGMARESNQGPNRSHLEGLLEHVEATGERGVDPTVDRKLPEIMLRRKKVGLPQDPWSFRMRRRNALAAVLKRGGKLQAAEAVLQEASAEPHEGSYAGFRALARLSLACRWLEWRRLPEAVDQTSLAETDASYVRDDVLRQERIDLVRKMRNWITDYGQNPAKLKEDEALAELQRKSGLERGVFIEFLSALWFDNGAQLKRLLPFVLDDATTADAVLGRLLGVESLQALPGRPFLQLVNALNIDSGVENE